MRAEASTPTLFLEPFQIAVSTPLLEPSTALRKLTKGHTAFDLSPVRAFHVTNYLPVNAGWFNEDDEEIEIVRYVKFSGTNNNGGGRWWPEGKGKKNGREERERENTRSTSSSNLDDDDMWHETSLMTVTTLNKTLSTT